MKKLYQELINGTFIAEFDINKPIKNLRLLNFTSIPVQPKLWSDIHIAGHTKWPVMHPMSQLDIRIQFPQWAGTFVGDVVVFSSAVTGAFISADKLTRAIPLSDAADGQSNDEILEISVLPSMNHDIVNLKGKIPNVGADWRDLVAPNDIGPPPSPTEQMLIPSDSPRICVGIAKHGPGQQGSWDVMVHEQYWKRDASSFSLAPHSTRLISTSHTSGRVETSSSEKSVSETLGTNLSAGWGPISASISASLSNTETTSRSVTLSESDSLALQETFENRTEFNEVILFWNLVDVYTWLSLAGGAASQLAVVEMLQAPALVRRYLQKPQADK